MSLPKIGPHLPQDPYLSNMKLDKLKGGRHQELTKKHKSRIKGDKKLCYGCNKFVKMTDYYSAQTRCKNCTLKKSRERAKKKNKPLW